VVIVFGALGYLMRRYSFPRPAMILGLVLGDLMEKYLYRSVASYGFSWMTRPAVVVIFVIAAVSLFFTLRGKLRAKEEDPLTTLKGAIARSPDEN